MIRLLVFALVLQTFIAARPPFRYSAPEPSLSQHHTSIAIEWERQQ